MTEFLPAELTADTVKALRAADDIIFHFHEGEVVHAWVTAIRRVKRNDGFGEDTRTIEITASHTFTIYERNGDSGRRMPTEAFSSPGSAKFCPQWVTAARFLKPGDRLCLHWTGGDVRKDLAELGWTIVHFDLEVIRKVGKSGREERLVFRLTTNTELATSGFYLKMPDPNPAYEINV